MHTRVVYTHSRGGAHTPLPTTQRRGAAGAAVIDKKKRDDKHTKTQPQQKIIRPARSGARRHAHLGQSPTRRSLFTGITQPPPPLTSRAPKPSLHGGARGPHVANTHNLLPRHPPPVPPPHTNPSAGHHHTSQEVRERLAQSPLAVPVAILLPPLAELRDAHRVFRHARADLVLGLQKVRLR